MRLGLDDPELDRLLRLRSILENDALFEQIGASRNPEPPSSQEGPVEPQRSPLVRRTGEGGGVYGKALGRPSNRLEG
jgi:hypothetical protein